MDPKRQTVSHSPATRLFHLHYNTPDVDGLEAALADVGLPLHRRFGWDDGEFTSLGPDERRPTEWRLRLETLRRGAVDLTLAPGRRFRFDHLGVVTSEFDAVVDRVRRAESEGWSVRDSDGRRPFVITPWGFRVEVHRDDGEVATELVAWETARLLDVRLVVPEEAVEAIRTGLTRVLGPVSELTVASGDVDRPTVPSFTLGGDVLSTPTVVDVASLAATSD
ncbi:hypothetical protein SAMN04487948_12120 [Halogranum amylolyticum]|uniref:Glyoxalase-like domain-containing protein n=1 Tax=Halogranum amylolyticum TaxID=660520 RepID=A0A1H8VYK9_9EURY|nr:hypothetical protein [Halogranum amylolyticum]SEP20479.1 hypothetical protein SAMN04487948_12120 [Halogranum amylolyticum]